MTLETIVAAVRELEPAEQEKLLELLTSLVPPNHKPERMHEISELEGLGAEVWQGIDAQEYVNRERDSWGG